MDTIQNQDIGRYTSTLIVLIYGRDNINYSIIYNKESNSIHLFSITLYKKQAAFFNVIVILLINLPVNNY